MNATALRRNVRWRDVTRVSAILVVSLAAIWTAPAMAQAPAWPSDAPKQAPAGGQAWPTDQGQQATAPGGFAQPAQPGGFGPPAQQGGFGPPRPGSGPPGGGMGPPPGNQAELQACNNEFNRLRGEVDKKGAIAKGISDRRGPREDLCKAITGLHGAMANWAKYAKSKSLACGIPQEAVTQLNAQQVQLGKVQSQVCNSAAAGGGAAPAARAPSLSEALGTSRPATQDGKAVKGGGTLDTLTGSPIR